MPARFWLASCLMWTLTACGDATSAGESGSLSRTPSSPVVDRSGADVEAHAARPTSAESAPGDPDPDRDRDPDPERGAAWDGDAANADATRWRPRYCAGKRTTRVKLSGSLDKDAPTPPLEWDATNYAFSANFSATMRLYDGGSHVSATVAFRREETTIEHPHRFSYHVLLGDPAVEMGSGYLDYDRWGALMHHEVVSPCAIPNAEAWPIDVWFGTPTDEGGQGRDGMIADEVATIARLWVDGAPSSLGIDCPDAEGDTPSTRPGLCPAEATRHLKLRANLSPGLPWASGPWQAAKPTFEAAFRTQLFAFDAAGAAAALDIFFRRQAAGLDYHVLLVGDPSHHELANGTLHFNDDGSLAVHRVVTPLRLPQPDGSVGEPIALDLGVGTAEGGTGVDGITSFGQASWVISSTRDGHAGSPLECGLANDGSDLSVPAPFDGGVFVQTLRPEPSAAGYMSTSLHVNACFSPNPRVSFTPFDVARPFATADLSATAEVIDAQLLEHRLGYHFSYLGDRRWRAHLLISGAERAQELGAVDLQLNEMGMLEWIEGPSQVRLPQANGRLGPELDLKWDQVVAWCNVGPYVAFGADGSLGVGR